MKLLAITGGNDYNTRVTQSPLCGRLGAPTRWAFSIPGSLPCLCIIAPIPYTDYGVRPINSKVSGLNTKWSFWKS